MNFTNPIAACEGIIYKFYSKKELLYCNKSVTKYNFVDVQDNKDE